MKMLITDNQTDNKSNKIKINQLVLFFIEHRFGSLLYKTNWFNVVLSWPKIDKTKPTIHHIDKI